MTEHPPRRRSRRATGGTVPTVPTVLGGAEAPPEPATPGEPRAPDDTDVGWGQAQGDDDERFLREVPPHW